MPSTKADIQAGAIFRPRMGGSKCVKMRPTDRVTIDSYAAPDVGIRYRSDGYAFIVSDTVLLSEYKLETKPPAFVQSAAAKPAVPAASANTQKTYDQGKYTVGSLWETTAGGKTFCIKILAHDATGTIGYCDVNDEGQHHVASRERFETLTRPFTSENNAPLSIQQPATTPKAGKSSCPHKHTAWYGDIKSCTDCGDSLETLQSVNPYNVDPDLKAIPSSVQAFMNRYGQPRS